MYLASVLSRFVVYHVGFSYLLGILQGSRLLVRLHQYQGNVLYGNLFVFGLLWRFRVLCGQVRLYFCLSRRVDDLGIYRLSIGLCTTAVFFVNGSFGSPRGVRVPRFSSRFPVYGHVMSYCFLLYGSLYRTLVHRTIRFFLYSYSFFGHFFYYFGLF